MKFKDNYYNRSNVMNFFKNYIRIEWCKFLERKYEILVYETRKLTLNNLIRILKLNQNNDIRIRRVLMCVYLYFLLLKMESKISNLRIWIVLILIRYKTI